MLANENSCAKQNIVLRATNPISYEKAFVDTNGASLTEVEFSPGSESTASRRSTRDGDLTLKLGLCPGWRVDLFPKENSALLSGCGRTLTFDGKLYMDLFPLLATGTMCAEQIEAQLQPTYKTIQVRTAIYHLSSQGVLATTSHSLNQKQALFWGRLGITPALAEERLHELPIHLASLTERPFPVWLRELMCGQAGWQFVDAKKDAELVIYWTASFTSSQIADINKQHLANGKKWLLVQIESARSFFSPIFSPTPEEGRRNRPCWECLRPRLTAGTENVRLFLGNNTAAKTIWENNSHTAADEALILALLHGELSAWLVDGDAAALSSHLVFSAPPHTGREYHWVKQRPQCSACGDRDLINPTRSPSPLVFKPQTVATFTSGGMRKKHPAEIVDTYKKLVSPLTGVITSFSTYKKGFVNAHGAEQDWYFVTIAGKNNAMHQKHLKGLKKGLRSNSSGKGNTAIQSQASAMCEALERYSGIYRSGEEICRRARYEDFSKGEAIHPNSIMLFSDNQYEQRLAINAQKNPHCRVPHPFDPSVELSWTPVWSLSDECFKYVMTQQLYYHTRESAPVANTKDYVYPDSNGCAAGSCLEEAVLQGFYELVERDAFAIWWCNRLAKPAVDLYSFDAPYLHETDDFYQQILGRNLWLLDVTSDLGIPTFVALSKNAAARRDPQLIWGAGAHLDAKIAAMRAVSELNQSVFNIVNRDRQALKNNFHQEAFDWFAMADPDRDRSYSYLAPSGAAPTKQSDHPQPEFKNAVEEINYLRQGIESRGMEMLVLNQTRPDIELPVVKVMVPGMRHFWSRFAPGRLYNVPVQQDLLSAPKSEAELNPVTVFL